MKFADKLVRLRKDKGISQEELAGMLNVSRQAISRWEMGSTLPDMNNIIRLSDIFEVSIDSLVRDDRDLENKKLNFFDKVKKKGDIALIASPVLVLLGMYITDDYEFLLMDKICNFVGMLLIVLGIISFVASFYLYDEDNKN